jgi:hypothetical protein
MGIRAADLLTAVGGGILLYTGLTDAHGNPRSLLRTLLAGNKPAAPSRAQQQLLTADTSSGSSGSATGGPAPSGSYQSYAQSLLPAWGWSGQWPALSHLEGKEDSGWDPNATNPQTGAYGIAQALGHGSGSATAGPKHNEYGGFGISNADAKAANSGDGYAQIRWMFGYIKSRYGSPNKAWAHEQSAGWY